MVLEIYLDPCTINSRKVLSGLDLLGVDYNYHFVSFFAGGQKDPDFVKNINPSATVPAAVDGDLKLTESNAILMYAADLKGSSLYPKDLKQRASVNRWLLWEASQWFASCYVYLIQNVATPELFGGKPDESALKAESDRMNRLCGILNDQLGKTKYIAGNDLTIADIAVAAPMHLHEASKLPLDQNPNLKRWIADIEKIPEWAKHQEAVERALMPSKFKGEQQANGGANGTSNQVRATFNYTRDLGPDKLTEVFFYESERANDIHAPGDAPHEMAVHDGWSRASEFSVDKQGFAISDFSHNYNGKWEDNAAVAKEFYPDVVEFLKKNLGAKRVLVFDHTIRTRKNENKKWTDEKDTTNRSPVSLVHCDYTAESGPVRVRQLLPDEAEHLLQKRVAFINVWKPLNVVEENPLAMCDVTTSPSSDFFKLYLRYRDRDGENYVMRHNDQHQWYYFPRMTPEKVILLKTYDSDEGRARFVGHSAFKDPTSREDAPFRESVEIRTICFF